jgi:predicted nucleic acid-binding protein
LSESFNGHFIIPKTVESEIITRPLEMKSHTLGAIRLKKLLLDGVIKVVETPNLSKLTSELLYLGNNAFSMSGRPLKIIHEGETESLALAIELGLTNILIDERTTRMLIEAPLDLKVHMEEEFKKKIKLNEKKLNNFLSMTKELSLFRSTELAIVGYEKGLFKDYGELEKPAIEAALYGLKLTGCGISFSEIEEFSRSI